MTHIKTLGIRETMMKAEDIQSRLRVFGPGMDHLLPSLVRAVVVQRAHRWTRVGEGRKEKNCKWLCNNLINTHTLLLRQYNLSFHLHLRPSHLPKKERKRRTNNSSKRKEDDSRDSQHGTSSFTKHQYPKALAQFASSNSSSSRSIQPSPTSATPRQVMRPVDEDYDEGVADALIVLANSSNPDGPTQSPTISSQSRHTMPSPRVPSHWNSILSTGTSPPVQMVPMKHALSAGPDESSDNAKCLRVELSK